MGGIALPFTHHQTRHPDRSRFSDGGKDLLFRSDSIPFSYIDLVNLFKFWLSSQGWKTLWVALRRSPRDPQARKNVFRLLLSLLFFPTYITFYAFFLHGAYRDQGKDILFFGAGCVLFVILLTIVIAFFQDREQRIADRDDPIIATTTKLVIYRETCLLAILLERLGSEIGMEKELPEGIEIITRRVLLDRLDELKLRDDLEPALREVLLIPDGHWPQKLKDSAFGTWECFYTLRWVLGLGELRALSDEPAYKTDNLRAACTVKQPEKLKVLPAWDIRPFRDAADLFLTRCWMELKARDAIHGTTEEDVLQAVNFRQSVEAEDYTADFLVGSRTVTELPLPLLWLVTMRAYHRTNMLALLVDVIGGEKSPSEIRTYFAGFFSLTNMDELSEAAAAESSS
jgi:hypothetical protein